MKTITSVFLVVSLVGCMTSGLNYETRSETYYDNGNLKSVDYELVKRDTRELFSDIDNAVFAGEIRVDEKGYTVTLGQNEIGIESSQALTDIGKIVGDLVSLAPAGGLASLTRAIQGGDIGFTEEGDVSVNRLLPPVISELISVIPVGALPVLINAIRNGDITFNNSVADLDVMESEEETIGESNDGNDESNKDERDIGEGN